MNESPAIDFENAKIFQQGELPPDLSEIAETTQQTSGTALQAATRAEIEMLTDLGHKYPRSITRYQQNAAALATTDIDTAESCFYVLPKRNKDGKPIEGPSIRCAEICASAWGNIRYGSRVIATDQESVTVQGFAHDTERGVFVSVEVTRRIIDKNGKRYGIDMIVMTINAASSIARRNAVFSVIPRAFIDPIYKAAKRTAIGDQMTLSDRRANAVEHFKKLGITPERLYAKLGIAGIEDITLEHVETLIGYKTALREGEIDIDDIFPEEKTVKVTGNAGALKNGKTKTDTPPLEMTS